MIINHDSRSNGDISQLNPAFNNLQIIFWTIEKCLKLGFSSSQILLNIFSICLKYLKKNSLIHVYNIFYSLYYKINKNSKQKEEGKLSYEWTRNHMTILNKIRMKNLAKKPLSGYKIGLCLHVTKETAVLAMAIKDLGGQIVMCSANPLSIQDNIAAFLTSEGIDTFAKRGETQEEYRKYILAVLKFKPD